MDDFRMPEFRDEDGTVWIWDSTSKSYVQSPDGQLPHPDRGHATGGDNDLFDPFQHTEEAGSPETEGTYASYDSEEFGEAEPVSRYQPGEHVVFRGGQGSGIVLEAEQFEGGWWYRVQKDDGSVAQAPEEACVRSEDSDRPGESTLESLGIPPAGEDYYRTSAEGTPKGHVKCPNCQEVTDGPACPTCGKDLTPEWNQEESNEFLDVMPQHSDASEFTSWPMREPKRNRMKTDDAYPSMTTGSTYELAQKLASRQITADEWDDMFSGQAPAKIEIGKWLIDKGGSLHIDHGMHALHEQIAARDGINYPGDVGALGSVYNDGTADVQRVFPDYRFDQQTAQAQITQAFGPVTLQAPVGQGGAAQKGYTFQPFEIHGGQWVVAPQYAQQPLTGIAWVKERPEGQSYQPHMILVAEHLQPEDFQLWSRGVTAIVTATGGLTSHAAYLASTEGVPVVVGIGEPYNKIETGNYLKIEPSTQTITVMPGASGEMNPEQKQNVWDSYLQYQLQRGGSLKPEYFAHIDEELAWRESNTPTLDSCPECSQPMTDQDGESVCHGCGHKQPIIEHNAAVLAPLGEAAMGGLAGGAEGGAAGGLMGGSGISGVGGLMQKALNGAAFRGGENALGGGGDAGTAGIGENFDSGAETQGVISRDVEAGPRLDYFKDQAQGLGSGLADLGAEMNQGAQDLYWGGRNLVGLWPKCPQCNEALEPSGDLGEHQQCKNCGYGASPHQRGMTGYDPSVDFINGESKSPAYRRSLWEFDGAFGEEEVGTATKNDGQNSDPDQDSSSGDSQKEHGDAPEQLKDVDGPGDAKNDSQGDPALQDKAMKAFHMNLPLVIEFAHSDEPGLDNPIIRALDELLEEAFPGYKDGHDELGAEDEHPVEEIHEEIHPEEKSEDDADDDKKSETKEAAAWGTPGDPAMGGFPQNNGDLMQMQQMQQPGAGGTCPTCGQSHLPGTPCPTPQMPAPAAAGGQVTPPQPQTVVTKWKVVTIDQHEAGAIDMAQDAGRQLANGIERAVPGLGHQCPECGGHLSLNKDYLDQCTSCGAVLPHEDLRGPDAPPYVGASTKLTALDAEFAFFTAAGEGEHHHEHEESHKPEHHEEAQDESQPGDLSDNASTPWLDESGAPLQEGADYELKSSDYAIPDRITIDRILPEKLVFTIHSGDVDYRDEISTEDIQTNGYSFAPAGIDDGQVDSIDGFQPEAPIRPGQDATPQQDDLSTPSTVVSRAEGEEHEYMPKFAGDQLADRSWLMEGGSGEVEVDPTLMAKLAAKGYSPREQREFIDESGEARNLDRLDLSGTHYITDDIDGAFNW